MMQRTAQKVQDSSPFTESALDRQLQQLHARCKQLEHLNDALKQALDEEQRVRRQERSSHQAQMANAVRRSRDLNKLKDESEKRTEDTEATLAQHKERLQYAEAQVEAERRESQRLTEARASELRNVEEQTRRQKDEHSASYRALELDMQVARRARDDAEGAAQKLREELNDYRNPWNAELERLQLALDDAHDAQNTVAELETQLKKSKSEFASMQAAKKAAEHETSNVSAELSELKKTRDDEATRVSADHRRAVQLAESLQKKLQELQQQLHDEKASRQTTVEQMQSSHSKTLGDRSAELENLRTEHEAQQSLLNSAILERDDAQDSLTAAQAELENLKADLADKESVERLFDARLSDKIQKRESYWQGKLRDSEKERQMMAKALLHQWGREEVGVDSPQGYEYRFITRKEGLQASS